MPGTTEGSIRNRISALRVKQRDLYSDLGWTLPEGGAGHSAKKIKATPSKRAAGGDGGVPETPTKKPRAPRKKESKFASPEKMDTATDDDEDIGGGVKQEDFDQV